MAFGFNFPKIANNLVFLMKFVELHGLLNDTKHFSLAHF